MALDHCLSLRQSTCLVMTPQLQLAIKLLQLSNQELESFVMSEVSENPFLRIEEESLPTNNRDNLVQSDSTDSDFENCRTASIPNPKIGLREHLETQINSAIKDPIMRLTGISLLDFLQPTGYLSVPLKTIASRLDAPLSLIEDILERLQKLDPPGVFARTLKECLSLQLRDKELLTPTAQVLLDNLDLIGQGNLSALCKKSKVDEETLLQNIRNIRTLSPKPGLAFDNHPPIEVVPEVFVRPVKNDAEIIDWSVELNPIECQKVILDSAYHNNVRGVLRAKEDQQFLSDRLAHANWLVRALQQRSDTLLKVSIEIMRQQENFLNHGIAFLKPLILRDVAKAVNLHESTVSRVTNNKFVSTPRGTFELKYFFNYSIENANGISHTSASIRHRIQSLIAKEEPNTPLSDDRITLLLNGEGISVARRTVAKYREIMRIPPAFQRKRWQPTKTSLTC